MNFLRPKKVYSSKKFKDALRNRVVTYGAQFGLTKEFIENNVCTNAKIDSFIRLVMMTITVKIWGKVLNEWVVPKHCDCGARLHIKELELNPEIMTPKNPPCIITHSFEYDEGYITCPTCGGFGYIKE